MSFFDAESSSSDPTSATSNGVSPGLEDDGASSSARPKRSGKLLAALVFGGLTVGAAMLGGSASKKKGWYGTLRKSRANPPPWVFGPVWTTLYSAMAYSGYRTWRAPDSAARTRGLRLWGLQLALNAAWSPLFFGAHRPKASAAVAAALVPAVGAYALATRKTDKLASGLMLPYLGWSAFATYLNAQILRKNAWRF